MTKLTDNKKKKFFAELATGQSVTAAALAISVSRTALYNLRDADEEFAAGWADAIEQGIDALEDEAVRRAKAGSDTLLIFLLKGARPEKYRERHEVMGKDGAPLFKVYAGIDTDNV